MGKSIISKVVFFDEQTALDYIEIRNKGHYVKEIEKKGMGALGIATDASAKTPKLLSLFRLNANVHASAEAQKIVRSTVSNTILTDFIDKANGSNGDINHLSGYDIELTEETKLSVYTAITDASSGKLPFDSSGMGMDISKFGSVLKNLQGYLECSAIKDGEPDVILRFNSECFRNNYKLADIISMNLEYYCVKVGSTDKSTLSAMGLELTGNAKDDKRDSFSEILNSSSAENAQTKDSKNKARDVYDVILAGVFSDESRSN